MVLFERGSAAWQNILATFTRSAVVMLAFCGASLATCNRKGGQASGMPRRFVGGEEPARRLLGIRNRLNLPLSVCWR